MRWLERTSAACAALLLAATLTACGGSSRPAEPRYASRLDAPPQLAGIHNDHEAPEFTIALPTGPTHDVAVKLATALVIAMQDHGIVATLAEGPYLKRINAVVTTRDAGNDIQIDVVWTVRDARGTQIGGNEQRVAGKPQDWAEGSDRLISRIAIQAAFRIARQLGRGDIANVPIAALPDAIGPGTIPPPPGTEGPPAPAPAPGTPEESAAAPPTSTAAARPPAAAAASNAARVFVVTVSGAGSRPMTSAMRRALGESQMVLTNRAEPGGYQVQGSVEVSPPAEGRQRIVIRWIVKRSDGTQIGDLEQANAVRAGSLDGSWDRLAPIVALAAVESIVDLINRDRASGGR